MCPGKAPTAFRLVCHRPNQKKRPQHMQGEQAYPACGMDCVLVGMMAPSCDPGRYVMDRDDAVEDRHDHENEQPECEIIQEWIAYLIYHFTPTPLFPISQHGGIGARRRFGPKPTHNSRMARAPRRTMPSIRRLLMVCRNLTEGVPLPSGATYGRPQ